MCLCKVASRVDDEMEKISKTTYPKNSSIHKSDEEQFSGYCKGLEKQVRE